MVQQGERGILGGLLGLGIPRHRAEYHEEQLRSGRSLVSVRTAEPAVAGPAVAGRLLDEAGAVEVDRGDDAELGSDDSRVDGGSEEPGDLVATGADRRTEPEVEPEVGRETYER